MGEFLGEVVEQCLSTLTVALFLGALPSFLGWEPLLPGSRLGAAVSLLSLVLLLASARLLEREKSWKS